uniref:Uncharacterized protein n=1 Tax=Oryza glumipatula TaxID=40148 RepID=A0A0D9YUA8_9ORYZ
MKKKSIAGGREDRSRAGSTSSPHSGRRPSFAVGLLPRPSSAAGSFATHSLSLSKVPPAAGTVGRAPPEDGSAAHGTARAPLQRSREDGRKG